MELFILALLGGPIVLLLCDAAPIFVELPPGSLALSELRRLYYERFSARLDREIDLAKPDGPAVN